MNYLFFDIECANCFEGKAKICEFGYVLINEQFEIIKKELFLINPKDTFDWYVLKNILTFKKEVYLNSPDYNFYSKKIKSVIESPNQKIIGHTIDADAKYLNDEAKRYGFPFFNYKFYDAKEMYSEFANISRSVGLDKISQEFGQEKFKLLHKSVDDAELTMLSVKRMCNVLECGIEDLILLCDNCSGETIDGNITTFVREIAKEKREVKSKNYDYKNCILGKNYIKFFQFLDGVKPQGEIVKSKLNGKTIVISKNYELTHFKEMLSIIQLLTNHGATYKLKASSNDIFVKDKPSGSNGEERYCTRLNYVNEAIDKGKDIEVIEFAELLQLLNVTYEEVERMPFPSEGSFLVKENSNKKAKKSKDYFEDNGGSTIGDILKAQGVII